MTCIVGLLDNGVTYMGGDSCASNDWITTSIKQKKVFKLQDTNNAIIGFSGAMRDLNLLQYATGLIDKRDEPDINYKYIVTKTIPQIIKLFSDNGRNESDKNMNSMYSYFLIGYKDKLWRVQFDYGVYESNDNYEACGSGELYADGALEILKDMDISPIEKIHKALQVATKYTPGVEPPFYIVNTNNDNVVEFKD